MTTSVRTARHTVRTNLAEIVKASTFPTPSVLLLQEASGHIFAHLQGREGMTPEQQTENLDVVIKHLTDLDAKVPEIIAGVKTEIEEAIAAFEALVAEKIAESKTTLSESVEYAKTRDFEAHQAAKALARENGYADVESQQAVEAIGDEAEAFANSGDLAAPKGEASDADSKEPIAETVEDDTDEV